jgi:hypothetical protein
MVAIAFGNTNLGTYTLTTEDLVIDGTMLKNMDITDEDIKFTVSFDFIINLKNISYKATMKFDLPCGDITENGKATQEITDTSKYVFKREKNK